MTQYSCAVVLAAGSGSRMGGNEKKQYLELDGVPLILHSLRAFEESDIEDVILVVPPGEEARCEEDIVRRFALQKVRRIVAGGNERFESVAFGLRAVANLWSLPEAPGHLAASGAESAPFPVVYIHDGARPFLTQELLTNLQKTVRETRACVAAMPAKNTIKIADEQGDVVSTPPRDTLWEMQTPQVFDFCLIRDCYERYLSDAAEAAGGNPSLFVPTDDAQLVEHYTDVRVRLVRASYQNFKVTTPEDYLFAKALCQAR